MELDNLKSQWQNAGKTQRVKEDVMRMTKIQHHPQLKRIRIKLMIECIFLLFFLLVFRDLFDGDEKPIWVNILLVSSILLFVSSNIWGYMILFKPIQATNLQESLMSYKHKLTRTAWLSISCSLYFGLTVLLFFVVNLQLSAKKYGFLVMMIITLLAMMYLSYRLWQNRIRHIEQALESFKRT